MTEKESETSIKFLRTDRGGEFNSDEFDAFLRDNGIQRQLTTERKNRTLMNWVRAMLAAKCVPKEFWAEAATWAIHVLNRTPTQTLDAITPEEAWSGKKPTVSYFRVFGCLCHVYIPDNRRTKLDDKSVAGVLLGVSNESKGYRVYNPLTKKIITSRDVVFEEDKQWNWTSMEENHEENLEWENEERVSKQVEEENSQSREEREEFTDGRNEDSEGCSTSHSSKENRVRKLLSWLSDYVREGEYTEDEDANANLALLV